MLSCLHVGHVVQVYSEKDPVRAHARDELGIDVDAFPDPWLAASVSCVRPFRYPDVSCCIMLCCAAVMTCTG